MKKNKIYGFATLIWLAALSVSSFAADSEYEVRVGATMSDNVTRSSVTEIEETIALAGLKLDLQHETRTVEAGLVTDLEYRNYTGDVFEDEVVGSLNADLLLQIVPRAFSWTFTDQFGKLQTDPFQANTAANRESVNRFSTGPDLRLRMGSIMAFELGGRFYVNQYEVTNADNDGRNGRLSLVRALSPLRSVSLNVTADRVEFDDTVLNSSYDRQSAFVGFVSEMSRGSLTVNIGYNEVHDRGEIIDGNLIQIEVDRKISPSATINLAYNEGFTDAGDTLGRTQTPGQGFGDPQQTAGVSDPFENQRFTLGFDVNRKNNQFFVTLLYNKDEYVADGALDRDRTELRAGLSRTLGSAWRFRLNGGLQRTDFVATGREDDDAYLGAGLSRQLSRMIAVNLDFTRFDRDSRESEFDYVENRVGLTFSYGQ